MQHADRRFARPRLIPDGEPDLRVATSGSSGPRRPAAVQGGQIRNGLDLGSGIRPGDSRGNALLNAHTWPDGSALGNKLLGGLDKGDPIVVHGPGGKVCYRVTDRVEVPATDEGKRYYAKKGQPQVAIVVCSGKRTGPGEWTKRTRGSPPPSSEPIPGVGHGVVGPDGRVIGTLGRRSPRRCTR